VSIAAEHPRGYVPAAESVHELFQLQLDSFDGPLDLLLFLIRKHEIDIFNIPIALICAEYQRYIEMFQTLELDVAGEFLFMAAQLLYIKSRMLLPSDDAEIDDEEEDPRQTLVERLLEYQKYSTAAGALEEAPRLGRDVFERQPSWPEPTSEIKKDEPELRQARPLDLVSAFEKILKRAKPEVRHHVRIEAVSLRERVEYIASVLGERQSICFEEVIGRVAASRMELIVSFLAVLELARMKCARVMQSAEGRLYVHAAFDSVDEVSEQFHVLADEREYGG